MARTWVWIAALAVVAAACASAEDDGTTTTSTAAETTTTAAAETTTTSAAAETTTTTTTAAETTTTAQAVVSIEATSVVGVLRPYAVGGADLFPPESVEAHWYQWDGFFVVLYRGFDAQAGQEICAGNSIMQGAAYNFVSNSPYLAGGDEICVNVPLLLEPPDGVQVCGPLLFYPTLIPVGEDGTLFGTLEIGTAAGFVGQTSEALTDPGVPEFEPGHPAYRLPSSNVDDLDLVDCGA